MLSTAITQQCVEGCVAGTVAAPITPLNHPNRWLRAESNFLHLSLQFCKHAEGS
jgi:hypothetical protein